MVNRMLKLKRSKNNKWIFQKNISSAKLIEAYIDAMELQKNIINPEKIKNTLKKQKKYKGRSKKGSINTMGVRLSQMCFYMTGYKKDGKFLPSTTTQMTRKETKRIDVSEAFLVNLFSMQYPNPYSNTPENFKIYFGRFLIKLLLDKRIDRKLYIDEFIWFLQFIETINEELYEELIAEILNYRNLSYNEKLELFHSVKKCDDVFSNCTHEINYYFLRIFSGFKVFELVPDNNHNDGQLFKFKHGSATIRNDAIGSRKRVSGYVKLSNGLLDKALILSKNYSAFDMPETQATADSKEDWIRNLYEFNMLDYIDVIDFDKKYDEEVITSVKDMVYQSKYGTNDGKSFENSLQPIFELFRENISADIIGGSGDTDLLCIMKNNDDSRYKVNVDAKKTKNRLAGIHTTRIIKHIRKNGSNYCIIVSPKFSKGAKTDIKGYEIVTIEAETLANYCLKECLNSDDGLADYSAINDIILNNQGTDITENVNDLIVERYQIP